MKPLLLLFCLPLMPVKAQSQIVYLECSGFEVSDDSSKSRKTYSVTFDLDESNSKLKMRKEGEDKSPEWQKASFNPSYITGKTGKESFLINRHLDAYSFTMSRTTNKNGTWSSKISGECKKKENAD